MKEFKIEENQAGQRFDKYLGKLLKEAPRGFFYKMLRKKNITLNGKKATGNEMLEKGDLIRLFISDETFEKFAGNNQVASARCDLSILYEDSDILLINKPAGMLSQPDKTGTPSLVEYLIGYLLEKGEVDSQTLMTFKPSVCNRLDRNTSGIVAAGKSLTGLQELSRLLHDRTLHKYYLCLTKGVIKNKNYIKGYLHKDEKCNKVVVQNSFSGDAVSIETCYEPLGDNGKITLLQVELLTGRPHQIRAHLASIGHPIIGDPKYGERKVNLEYGQKYRLKHQLLHAYRLEIPQLEGKLSYLSGKCFTAPVPDYFLNIIKDQQLEESYYE